MDPFDAVDSARDWGSYHRAVLETYRHALGYLCGLGEVLVSQHVHHTLLPDASGTLVGGASWSVFSQPSSETLLLQIGALGASGLPFWAQRSHRYVFLTMRSVPPSREAVALALGQLAGSLDFWSDSLRELAALGAAEGPLYGLQVLSSVDEAGASLVRARAAGAAAVANDTRTLAGFRRHSLDAFGANSVVSARLRAPFVDSFVAMAAVRADTGDDCLAQVLGPDAGLALALAASRAKLGGWSDVHIARLNGLAQATPLRTRDRKVAPGETLSGIVRAEYGLAFPSVWPFLSLCNPGIKDPDRIRAGATIRLPRLDE